jgi:hypothetical protein
VPSDHTLTEKSDEDQEESESDDLDNHDELRGIKNSDD